MYNPISVNAQNYLFRKRLKIIYIFVLSSIYLSFEKKKKMKASRIVVITAHRVYISTILHWMWLWIFIVKTCPPQTKNIQQTKKPVAHTDTLTDRSKLQYIPQLVAWVIIRCCSFSLDMSSSFVNLMKQLAAHMSKYMILETTMPIISRENSN